MRDLGTNGTVSVDLGPSWGWGPDDTVFSVARHAVHVCAAHTGRCTDTPIRLAQRLTPGQLVLGGLPSGS